MKTQSITYIDRNKDKIKLTLGDLVTAITMTVGEGMLYRIVEFDEDYDPSLAPRYRSVRVEPVFVIWTKSDLSRRKAKLTDAINIVPVSLKSAAADYARLGLFIQDEARRLSSCDR